MAWEAVLQRKLIAPSVHTLSLLFLLTLQFALGFAIPSTHDPDIWWHLKTGEWIISHGTVPWADPFGDHTSGMRWVAYSWLPEALFHLVDKHDPVLGLRYIQGAVAAMTVGILYAHARATSGSPRLALLLCLLFLIPTFPWLARPQMFSFLLAAASLYALWWGKNRDARAWWLLPLLMALWANLHIYFVFGLGLIWLIVGWPWLAWYANGRPAAGRPPIIGIVMVAVTTAAPLLNPYGLTLYDEAIRLAFHGSNEWPADVIRELASPNFHDWPRMVFYAWVVLGFLAFLRSPKVPPALDLLLFIVLLHLALQHLRDIPYYLIVMLPILARHLGQFQATAWRRFLAGGRAAWLSLPQGRAVLHWFIAAGAVAAFAMLPIRFCTQQGELAVQRHARYPAAAVAYLLEKRPEGPLYNSLNWGGYLIHALAPTYRVYIDGRTQLYSREFWESHDTVRHGREGWDLELDASGAQIVLWSRDEPVVSLLRLSADWTTVYEDEVAVIFVRKASR